MIKGSCLCGEIAYEVSQLDLPIEHCSCHTCRKAHAAAFNTAAGVHRDHFHWLKGSDKLNSYESSPGKFRHFCSNCGSHLVGEKLDQDYLILRVATLDDDPGLKPEFQIWQSHEVSWLEYGAHVPSYSEWEPGHGI
jgi:ADP-ribosyl-[dinitrogen reductase] hydrolase